MNRAEIDRVIAGLEGRNYSVTNAGPMGMSVGWSAAEQAAPILRQLVATHDELVAALQWILPLAERYLHDAPGDPDNAKLESARAALAKVQAPEQARAA